MTGSYDVTTRVATRPLPIPARAAGPRFPRLFGALCAAGGLIAVAGAAWSAARTSPVSTDEVSWPYGPGLFQGLEVVWTLTHVLTFLGALALARSGLAGRGRAARAGNPVMLVGMALFVPCELAFIPFAHAEVDDSGFVLVGTLIGVASMIAGLGFTLTGIGVLRERALRGAGRFVPLLCGVFVFVGLTPLVMAGGDVFFLGIGGWNVLLALLGVVIARTATAQE
ncbi:hypothetical protein I6A84_05330 [Frankia sp. CNm7]|uniref:DUF998 domain-containing protein n=1 Tax=Frankia nepalensis TaxID=1836974 RepID=A0A937UT99_9ACTN|nr:hypothetical protein [Frankia nepalensis]MBL7497656.1 hypothetical protein [Frankia nepalensis]MBL7510029.1 hypothetical protein [Frankia nepalensis]MBL7517561.1 hypothetical protein [Frankia nepalensis]MBL7631050.1 hypothetical protein [Frankia nepalensis]